ncbi:MAG: hypothetical protein M3Z37_11150 [Candidatus Eremiobacteraeota bacterium]|nr:hypothetical protein [Candidatus Eremiobacteraeota bacterium]
MIRNLIAALLLCLAMSSLAMAANAPAMQLPPQPKDRPDGMPANAVMVSPCIAHMGEHWVALKDWSVGPIYGTWQGKVIFSEIMVTKAQLDKGFNFDNLRPLPGHTINHVDLEYHPKGHPGLMVPHYDLHAYYIPHEAEMNICPNGIKDPDQEMHD